MIPREIEDNAYANVTFVGGGRANKVYGEENREQGWTNS